MMTRSGRHKIASLLFVVMALAGAAQAHDTEEAGIRGRWDVSMDVPIWPALTDLQPVALGSFDSNGFGLGVAYHVPVASYANSDILLGVDGSIAATDSNIHGRIGSLMARQLYLGGSVKWLFGAARNLSLDAGLGYHEVDMAQIDAEWWGTEEFENWGTSKASGFVGATWDIGAGRKDKHSGLFVALRAHFADFGRVYDEDAAAFFPTLGTNAGTLDGPLYMLRIGYSTR